MRLIALLLVLLPMSAVAGQTQWTQTETRIEHTCRAGERLELVGAENTVTLRGHCGSLTIVGAGNRVQAERIDAVDITGAETTVTHTNPTANPPRVQVIGAGSGVRRAERGQARR